jgi:hypothetical protein
MKVRMEGFIALDYASRYPEARTYLADQLQRGNLQYEYTIFKPESKDRRLCSKGKALARRECGGPPRPGQRAYANVQPRQDLE